MRYFRSPSFHRHRPRLAGGYCSERLKEPEPEMASSGRKLLCRFRLVGWIEIARVGRTKPRDLHDDSVLVPASELAASTRLWIDTARRKLLARFRIGMAATAQQPGA